jgi:hypothetical protein
MVDIYIGLIKQNIKMRCLAHSGWRLHQFFLQFQPRGFGVAPLRLVTGFATRLGCEGLFGFFDQEGRAFGCQILVV